MTILAPKISFTTRTSHRPSSSSSEAPARGDPREPCDGGQAAIREGAAVPSRDQDQRVAVGAAAKTGSTSCSGTTPRRLKTRRPMRWRFSWPPMRARKGRPSDRCGRRTRNTCWMSTSTNTARSTGRTARRPRTRVRAEILHPLFVDRGRDADAQGRSPHRSSRRRAQRRLRGEREGGSHQLKAKAARQTLSSDEQAAPHHARPLQQLEQERRLALQRRQTGRQRDPAHRRPDRLRSRALGTGRRRTPPGRRPLHGGPQLVPLVLSAVVGIGLYEAGLHQPRQSRLADQSVPALRGRRAVARRTSSTRSGPTRTPSRTRRSCVSGRASTPTKRSARRMATATSASSRTLAKAENALELLIENPGEAVAAMVS